MMTRNRNGNRSSISSSGSGGGSHVEKAAAIDGEDVEYYPRHRRAPYLYDVSDFGISPTSSSARQHHDGDAAGWDLIDEDGDGTEDASSVLHMRSASSSNLSTHPGSMRRRSSFARVFSTLGMSPGPTIAEDGGGEGQSAAAAAMTSSSVNDGPGGTAGGSADEGGGSLRGNLNPHFDDSETNPNSLLPQRFRRGSSATDVTSHLAHHRRMTPESTAGGAARDRLGSHGGAVGGHGGGGGAAAAVTNRFPQWALHDQSAIVMWDGVPVPMEALLHRRTLASPGYVPPSMSRWPQCILTPTWRLKERMKTVGVCLVLALSIGTDPPDLNKPTPCAKLQCWLDPTSISRAKAKERIGERLEQQYARWQQRSKLRYRRALDPTVDAVRDLCLRMRESARGERVLLHYNGHGVPRPTANGEIWLFDKNHTNYIPLSVTDLRRWLGRPSVVVLDCSSAGVLMPFFTAALADGPMVAAAGVASNTNSRQGSANGGGSDSDPGGGGDVSSESGYLRAIRDTIVLCPTSQGEWLPLNPAFPADVFTSCLTTPIPMALKWFVHQTPLSARGLDLDPDLDVESIPGKLADRKTPLGLLNWTFTAVTDTIAWNVLPGPLFQRLFRQDLLVASMFRNFLLADRILRGMGCAPSSHPELPSTCRHPLWQAWDLAVETCLTQLVDSGHLRKKGTAAGAAAAPRADDEESTDAASAAQQPSVGQAVANPSNLAPSPPEVNAPFFAEHLTAFEIWLEWASARPRGKLVIRCPPGAVGGTPLPFLQGRRDDCDDDAGGGEVSWRRHEIDPPQELPIVLQVLLSQAHRVRALALLRRFLDLGPSAVNLALSVGIFPYVLKLLQSPIDEYKHVLVGIWAKVVGFDPSCQEDVVKDRALPHFIRHLEWGLGSSRSGWSPEDCSKQREMAAFILCCVCWKYPLGQNECINEKLHIMCGSLLQSLESPEDDKREAANRNMAPQFRMWLIICVGNLAKDNPVAQSELYKAGLHFRLHARLEDDSPDVRAASCYALGCLIGSSPSPAAKSNFNTATGQDHSMPSILQQQLQPQQASPAFTPAFQGGTATLPSGILASAAGGRTNAGVANPSQPFTPAGLTGGPMLLPSLTPSFAAPQGHRQLQPQPAAVGFPGVPGPACGVTGLMPGGNQPMMFSNILSASSSPAQVLQQQQPPEPSSVYEDEQRMDLDLSAAVVLAKVTADASPMVRFEAMISLNRCIGKYLEGFVSAAGKSGGGKLQGGRSVLVGGSMPSIPMPQGLNGTDVEKNVIEVWAAVFKLHRSDPFPLLRELVNSIVVAINRQVMSEKAKLRQLRAVGSRRRSLVGSNDEDTGDFQTSLSGQRTATGMNLPSYDLRGGGSPPQVMKRARSAGANSFTIGTPPTTLTTYGVSPKKGYNQPFPQIDATSPVEEYFYPESKFFAWKRVLFKQSADSKIIDPLSNRGAMNRYRESRNSMMWQKSHLLKESFAVLAERPTMGLDRSPYTYDESDAAAGVEREADLKKDALHLQQVSLIRNSGARSTSLLRFHPFEPALVVCGSFDNVSVWNAETSERMVTFSNGNPKNTRMTSALWVNEASTSLLLTGSSDGTVRFFDGLFEPNDEISCEKPSLISSFVAAPGIVTDKLYSSGLVLEFQQFGGQLIAGGNTKVIRCWDVVTEKCSNMFESKSDASLTTLTTAWRYDFTGGYSGLGPDIIVAGYGNGSLRVFDTRTNQATLPQFNSGLGRHGLSSRRRKFSDFDEHTSWIVDLSFTTYGGRDEIVSGCVAGSIKFWDLRYSSSVRTIDHKMQMTALAAHSNVPMFATGSPAQFIKIMSHDGMTQQVIKYHEKIPGQRIGPVSCLCFHPHIPYLAAGFADEIVSLYAPKDNPNI